MFHACRSITAALLLTVTGSARAEPAPAAGDQSKAPAPGTPCVAPWGVDLCAVTGVDVSFAVGTFQGGTPIASGTRWSPIIGWATNAVGGILPDFPLTYREGYVTRHPKDPMKDFLEKIERLRLIVDPGTPDERVYTFRDPVELAVVTRIGDFYGPKGLWGFAAINPGQWVSFAPSLPPLGAGRHVLELVWTLSAEHCDGFPSMGTGEPLTVEGGHCIPAGDFAFYPVYHAYDFAVAPRGR